MAKVYLETSVILGTVSDYLNIDTDKIVNCCRCRDLVKARHIAMYLHCIYTDMTLTAIRKIFNRKTHCSVIHARKSVTNQAEVYPAYRFELDRIMRTCEQKIDLEFEKYQQFNIENV